MTKSKFNPNRIKMLLEYKGHGRVTDSQLAEMFNVKVNTIARWKIKTHPLFDKINKSGITFFKLTEMPNKDLVAALGLNPLMTYEWNKKRPKLFLSLAEFLEKHNLTFEEIYQK
jgi:hypothetical protein